MRRVVDLSVPLDAGTQVYPGDPAVRTERTATIDRDGYHLLAVHLGSQSGTHCDAPYHFLDGGTRIDELDLRLFAGPGVLVDVRGRPPRYAIEPSDLGPLEQIGPSTVVVLHTGWSAHYGMPRYVDHPYLRADACRVLLDRGVCTIGIDTPNVDETPSRIDWPCHRMIADAGGVIVENLTNLAAVDFPDPFLSVLPLRLTGADGAPCRAVAMELER